MKKGQKCVIGPSRNFQSKSFQCSEERKIKIMTQQATQMEQL